MSSFWESKYLSSEKSVQFLQQTHEEILKGLHEEIQNLQKQCSDYALRLSMRASTDIEKEEFDQKFKSFNLEYQKKDNLILDQQNLINERNKNIKNLTERVKALEKKLEQESNPKDLTIRQLKKELEAKGAQIAQLSYQLHNANKSNKTMTTQHQQQPQPQMSIDASKELSTSLVLNTENRMKSPTRLKKKEKKFSKKSHRTEVGGDGEDLAFENMSLLNHNSKTSISNINERVRSAESLLIDNDLNMEHGFKGTATSLKSFTQPRLTASMSSTNSERASPTPSEVAHINELKNKLLPPVAVVKRSLDANIPDPKPFLQSMSSTLHSRSKKELMQRRTLIALPQIKSYEAAMIQQLAVESPIKYQQIGQQHVNNNNNSAN